MRAITILAGGYAGITAAVHYAKAGWRVTIYDPDRATVDGISTGTPRTNDFLAYLNQPVSELVKSGILHATVVWGDALGGAWDDVTGLSVFSIAVPTERNGEPYDAIVLDMLFLLGEQAPINTVIIVESTLTPGTIDRLFADHPAIRERVERHEIALAVCPRRDWFADPTKNLETLPRVVGGVTSQCTNRALEILTTVSRTLLPTTYRTAEIVKALENALLHVPVMLCHQLALARPDLDVAEAMGLVTTHWRFESMAPIYLGMGCGGRCVPLGTKYLVAQVTNEVLTIGVEALSADLDMRGEIARIARRRLTTARSSAVVLGIAYRPEFKDMGLSPGLAVAEILRKSDPRPHVFVHDPCWSPDELERLTGFAVACTDDLRAFDVVLLATPHAAYSYLPRNAVWRPGTFVLDGQGTWERHAELLASYGVEYRRIGRPGWRD